MAYSKTPENDTHSVKRIPAVGSPFVIPNFADAIPVSLNYYNCFPIKEKQFGQEAKFSVEKREPYITYTAGTTAANTSKAFSRWTIASQSDALNYIYFARNDTYYYTVVSTGVTTAINTYATATETGACTAKNSTGEMRIVAASGTTVNTWLEDATGFTTTVITPVIAGQCGLVFLNGYIFAVGNLTNIYNSTAGGLLTTWATTDFIAAEMYTDDILRIGKHHNHLVVFGAESIEFFYDAAIEIGSPLARAEQYATKMGIALGHNGYINIAYDNDDIYFITKGKDKANSLARIRDFRVEELDNAALEKVLNSPKTSGAIVYDSIHTWTVNNRTMILIKFISAAGVSTGVVYDPATDSWWTMDQTDIGGTLDSDDAIPTDNLIGSQVFLNQNFGGLNKGRVPYHLISPTQRSTTAIQVRNPDKQWTTSNTAIVWTDVIDMDVNRWKHIYKVDAVGDYRTNTLTLAYCDNMTYDAYTTVTPDRVQSTQGEHNPVRWSNIGQWRQFSLRLTMAGAYPATHTGFEISYNLKMQ